MSEKKKAGKAAKKSGKTKNAKPKKKETNPADVRKKVSSLVKKKAIEMAEAVIGKTEEGKVPEDLQLATVKYMFEVAAIYPPQGDQEAATDEEDSLAKTLLRRLNIPDEPIRRDEDEEAEMPSVEKTLATTAREKSESKDSGAVESGESRKPESV